ncbi:MAG: sulfotransferase, partial [Myxococcota bacterium]
MREAGMIQSLAALTQRARPTLREYRSLMKAFVRSLYLVPRYRQDFAQVEAFCLFIGYPRSGHSLIGSLLTGHPECVISHELNALAYVRRGFRREQLFALILDRDQWFSHQGREWTGFDYSVEGLWQGHHDRLRVIGDKKGGASTLLLERDPTLLHALR